MCDETATAVPFSGIRQLCRAGLLFAVIALPFAGCGDGSPPASGDATDSAQTDDADANSTSGEDPPLPVASGGTGTNRVTPNELHARLKERNPQYKNNAQIGQEDDGLIVAVSLRETAVTDLSPLGGLKLRALDLFGTDVVDLSPLAGMPLQQLMADQTQVDDVAPLKGMPLKSLWLNQTKVVDLSPLRDAPIEQLNLFGTKVEDLSVVQTLPLNTLWLREVPAKDFSPLDGLFLESLDVEGTSFGDADLALLKAMPLQRLNIAGTQVTDLTPLRGLKLTRLIFTPARIKRGLEIVRSMNTLQELDVTFREPQRLSPTKFWARYAAGAFKEQND